MSNESEIKIQNLSMEDLVDLLNDKDRRCSAEIEILRQHFSWHHKQGETLLGGLWLERPGEPEEHQAGKGVLALVGSHHFFLACLTNHQAGEISVDLESAPMGRLRSVKTLTVRRKSCDIGGNLVLDFAGRVFRQRAFDDENQVFYDLDSGWPSEEVSEFLEALSKARR